MTITAIFFDVGGVLGTNGWDRQARRATTGAFGLDWEEFQDRHESVASDFEVGRLDLAGYLDRTVFYRNRDFGREEFIAAMLDQSVPDPEMIDLAGRLAGSGDVLMATLNNESRELNRHRIELFGLEDVFDLFLSSCYLGVRKPEPEIYRIAMDVTARAPGECLFIDDRALNTECASIEGMQSITFRGLQALVADLTTLGIPV